MATLSIELPEDVLDAAGKTPDEFGRELRLAAAVKWCEVGAVSQGRAAQIAGVSRSEFLDALSQFKVSLWQYSLEEIDAELNRAG